MNIEKIINKAWKKIDKKKYKNAIGLLQEALSDRTESKDQIDALDALGYAYIKAGQLDSALKAYQDWLVLKPGDPIVLSNIGRIYQDQSDYNSAAVAYQQSIDAGNRDVKVFIVLAQFYRKLQEEQKRRPHLDKALEYHPKNLKLYELYGDLEMQQGNDVAALTMYNRAMQLSNTGIRLGRKIGTALLKLGYVAPAKKLLKMAVKLEPHNSSTLYNLAYAEYALGHKEKTITLLQKLIRLDANFTNAHLFLKQIQTESA